MFDPTDSFFIESGREMLETHKFIVPLMNYEPWLDKPALDFCLIAASLKAFGVGEFAGRLPSALAGILECSLLYLLSRRILTKRQSFFSSLILLSSPLFVIVGRVSLADEPLSLLITTALLSFSLVLINQDRRPLVLAYLAVGLAVLLKGPLGLVVTGLIVAGYLLASNVRTCIAEALSLRPIQGLGIVLAVALPYYLWAHIGTGGEFTTTFFLRQNLGRAVGAVNHVRPFWWYFPVALVGTFPWSLSLIFGGKFLLRCLVKGRRGIVTNRRQKFLFFALCWAVLGFGFFSAVPTKLETYIVPILPAVAILAGCYLDALVRASKTCWSSAQTFAKPKVILPGPLVATVLLTTVALIAIAAPFVITKNFDQVGRFLPFETVLTVSFALLCIVGLFSAARGLVTRAIGILIGTMLACSASFIPLLFSVYHQTYQLPIDRLVAYARQENAHMAVMYFPMPSVIFRYKAAIPVIATEKDMLTYAEANPDKQWILIREDVLSLLKWTERSPRVVAHEGRWWLFAVGRQCKQEDTIEWNGPAIGHYPSLAERGFKG